jgi:phage gpG-like protein
MNDFLNFKVEGQPRLESIIKGLPAVFDTKAILDEGAAVIFNRIRIRYLQEVDPQGEPWPRSMAAILRERRGIGGGTLYSSGKLFHSLQLYAESENSRAIGTNVTSDKGFPYPIVHQFGLGGQIRRQFLGFGDEDRTYMSDLVLQRIQEGLAEL